MEAGNIRPISIDTEMRGAYLDYAMSVITARALPDVRDGLKPVQRRILYAMDELGLRSNTAYKKSARIVGEVLGKYHPHGDAPVYETMVRMAQQFSLRYMLVDGQGNFGSVDGDPPAAMRYTEARLSAIAEELLADIDKDTVDFTPNFDDTLKEPSVLPAKLPNLLINGSSGIAVGMATNIPPHNLGEIVDALLLVLTRLETCLAGGVPATLMWASIFNQPIEADATLAALDALGKEWAGRVKALAAQNAKKPTRDDQAQALLQLISETTDVLPEDLLQIVKGPDFPTAGIIQGSEGIRSAYATGHGRVILRARAHIEDMRGSRQQIVVTELPYQLNKSSLLEKIAELVRDKRIEGISELRDESDRQGMRIVIELRRDTAPRQVLNQLFRYTQMQTTFSINTLALVDGQPRVLNLEAMLQHYVQYRQEVLTRRTQFDLAKARAREHILQGLKIALDHLDEVIALIRRSRDAETARTGLMRQFKLTDIQAQAILDMQLRRLAALERRKIIEELEAILKLIASLEDLLAHPAKILGLIRDDLIELKAKYGDARRTTIVSEEATAFTDEDLIPDQDVIALVTAKSYVRRVAADSFLSRRGRGQAAVVTQEEDALRWLGQFNTHDTVVLFSQLGRAFGIRAHELPDAGRTPRGLPISNLLLLEENERIVAGFPLPKEEGDRFCILVTAAGDTKRLSLAEMGNLRPSGIQQLAMAAEDELIAAAMSDGKQEIIIITRGGQALRFAESELRASGRGSGGVRGIRLASGDRVVSADLCRPRADLVLVTSNGFIKRTELSEFPVQGRGGSGVKAINATARSGDVAAAAVAALKDEALLASAGGLLVRVQVETLTRLGRTPQGIRISELAEKDQPSGLWVVTGKNGDSATPASLGSGSGSPPAGPGTKAAPRGRDKAATPPPAAPQAAPEKPAARRGLAAPVEVAPVAAPAKPARRRGTVAAAPSPATPEKPAARRGLAAPVEVAPVAAPTKPAPRRGTVAAAPSPASPEKPAARRGRAAPVETGPATPASRPRGTANRSPQPPGKPTLPRQRSLPADETAAPKPSSPAGRPRQPSRP